MLRDGNNNRTTWIAAGRALTHAKELSKFIVNEEHLRVLELYKLKYRNFFHDMLANKPAAFFYGADDPTVPLNQAAADSSAPEDRSDKILTSTVKELSEESIYAVWEAAQWPHDFDEELRRFTTEERDKLLVLYPGLYRYLEHKDTYHTASGQVFPKNNNGDEMS
ncbi:MAG: hypothetical protein K9I74_12320 [Bacteroidales bacterium]|nr:hypothetical protein [Bacteroidales bacterium]